MVKKGFSLPSLHHLIYGESKRAAKLLRRDRKEGRRKNIQQIAFSSAREIMWSGALVAMALTIGAAAPQHLDARNHSLGGVLTLAVTLQSVDASDNNLEGVDAVAPTPLLRSLTLRNNRLTTLPTLVSAPLLATLDVADNALRRLPRRPLALPALRRLNLSGNALTALPPRLLVAAPRLRTLDASRNAITTLAPMGVERRRMSALLLSRNKLTRIDTATLEATRVTSTLDLSANVLRRFPGAALRRAAFIANVDVADNRIRHVAAGDLDDVQVVALDLSGQVERVDVGAFRRLPLLRNLTLARSLRMRYLPADAFGSLPALRHVDVSGNALLAFAQPPSWSHAPSMDVSGNALLCHCANAWLGVNCAIGAACTPTILPTLPGAAVVAIGADIELHCATVGADAHWIRHADVVTQSADLRIGAATLEDAGVYACVAGDATHDVNVTVLAPRAHLVIVGVGATHVTLAWNAVAPLVLRWGESGANETSTAAPHAHSYAVHGLRMRTTYCFALGVTAAPHLTLDRACVTTRDDVVGVRRSYAAVVVLVLTLGAAVSAIGAVCFAGGETQQPNRRRAHLVEGVGAAYFIELEEDDNADDALSTPTKTQVICQ